MDLELNHDFVRDYHAHTWLLHWLFLDSLNDDIQEWAEAWNHHRISRRGQADRSPRDLFVFSVIEDGVRGMARHVSEDVVDPATYGIDWEVFEDSAMRTHLAQAEEEGDENPPDEEYEVPNPPFTDDMVNELQERLNGAVDRLTRNMTVRRHVWTIALHICRDLELANGLDRCNSFHMGAGMSN